MPKKTFPLRALTVFFVCTITTLVLGVNTFMHIQTFNASFFLAEQQRSKALAQAILEDVDRLGLAMSIDDMAGLLARHCYQLYELNKEDGITSIFVLSQDATIIAHSDTSIESDSKIESKVIINALHNKSVNTVIDKAVLYTLIPIGFKSNAFIVVGWNRSNFDAAVRRLLLSSLVLFFISAIVASIISWLLLSYVFKQLDSARCAAESATNAKSSFLANMSHDIRTPMNAIIGLSRLLQETELTEKQRNYLEIIHASGRSLLGIVNDILDFSKIEADKVEIESLPISIKKIVNEVYCITHLQASEKKIDFKVYIAPDIPENLLGDSLRLTQVLLNLLNNAIKFTSKGMIVLEVQLIAKESKQVSLRFSVRDSGIGISKEQAARLFTAFTQADNSTTRKYGGTGLGLVICQRLIALMGGKIALESSEGRGSCFYFTLPFKIDTAKLKLANLQEVSISEKKAKMNASYLKGKKVLLIDDNFINQMVAREILESYGIQTVTGSNGIDAVKLVLSGDETFDLVLMDVQMPEMDGYEACRTIRQNKKYEALPIIALTAHALEEEKQKCLNAGMNDHLAKPIEPDYLLQILLQWIPESGTLEEVKTVEATDDEAQSTNKVYTDYIYSISEIDADRVLTRLSGDSEFFVSLLKEFKRTWSDAYERLYKCIESGDVEKARAVAHSLHGVAGTLGMMNVMNLAFKIEKAILNKENSETQKDIEELKIHLDSILESLTKLP